MKRGALSFQAKNEKKFACERKEWSLPIVDFKPPWRKMYWEKKKNSDHKPLPLCHSRLCFSLLVLLKKKFHVNFTYLILIKLLRILELMEIFHILEMDQNSCLLWGKFSWRIVRELWYNNWWARMAQIANTRMPEN